MAIKPEDVLKAIAAARGNAICVPTMTTSPAWREHRPRRSLGRLRRLHGRRLVAGPRAWRWLGPTAG